MFFLQVKELIAKDEIEIGDILSHYEKTAKQKRSVGLEVVGAISESRPLFETEFFRQNLVSKTQQ